MNLFTEKIIKVAFIDKSSFYFHQILYIKYKKLNSSKILQ